ncbi:single-stranded DNA-binding protein [Helicobacter sp. 12S02232-10]|uniref:single-stranded DNA-binding protein n=1 Tax=Helicobacter sp. 12S02232-10 TaxID=1476197 RepID=UPI000BA589E0|nr:single-stranded DNA-binding protein [Helicobacter sp. 12S02232-10]PAF49437.1 single-stranded DNA-binding protein [Helicobacter sp. 12S02232-10]
MYNKVIMVGFLTRDVEMKYLPSGSALATLGLASNRRFKKQDGSQGEEVCFVDVKLFGRAAEVANQYLHKGSKVLIDGRLTLESWTDQNGVKKSRHTITAESMQMMDLKSDANENPNPPVKVNDNNSPENECKPIDVDEGKIIPLNDETDETIPF